MRTALLAMVLILLCSCDLFEQASAPLAHAVTLTPPPIEFMIKQDHGSPKREAPAAAAGPPDPTTAILDAIGRAKDTVERRSYILDDRADKEIP